MKMNEKELRSNEKVRLWSDSFKKNLWTEEL